MFPRAKPYINSELIKQILNNNIKITESKSENYFYFSSGRAALKWFLIKMKENGAKRVGVQAFTCNVIKDAILESGYEIVYLDTDINYFTTTMNELKGNENIDILILTHLFGIPNPKYIEIKKWASINKITILDDLSQTVNAEIDGIKIEELSENFIYSFAYDKPISAYEGGVLRVSSKMFEKLNESYRKLAKEKYKKVKLDLMRLMFFEEILKPEFYDRDFRTNSFLERFLIEIHYSKLGLNNKIVVKILKSKFNKVLAKIEKKIKNILKQQIKIEKMNEFKICYLQKIMAENIENNKKYFENLKKANLVLKDKNIEMLISENNNFKCSPGLRFPIIRENREAEIVKLMQIGIEANSSNWNKLICEENCENIKAAFEISKKIINIPIWNSEMWGEDGKKY